MNEAMQSMAGPISGRQRAIVDVLRAGHEASIVRVRIIGHLRAFAHYPRAYYIRRQLTHFRHVLSLPRPLTDTGRQCARRQSGPIGENALLMTLFPSIEKSIIQLSRYIVRTFSLQYCMENQFKLIKVGFGVFSHICATPPLPQKKWTPFLQEVQTLKTATVKNDFTICSS